MDSIGGRCTALNRKDFIGKNGVADVVSRFAYSYRLTVWDTQEGSFTVLSQLTIGFRVPPLTRITGAASLTATMVRTVGLTKSRQRSGIVLRLSSSGDVRRTEWEK